MSIFLFFIVFFLKMKIDTRVSITLDIIMTRKLFPVSILRKKARDEFESVTIVLSDENEKRYKKKNPACFLVRI